MIRLSDHFGYKNLLKYALPSIMMMIFTSIYSVVDGFFVSNYVGKTPFAAVNLIWPVLMILDSIGFMFGTGGAALVAMRMGQGKEEEAKKSFSLIVYTSIAIGVLLAVLSFIFIEPIAIFLKAEGELLSNCALYGRIILPALPFAILQYEFQCMFPTAEKPKLGLYVSIAAGCTNMILDALFVAVFSWGLAGAAAATAISQLVGGALPLIYFICKNNSRLRFTKCRFEGRTLALAASNGASEFMSNIAMSFVSMLYNAQLMKYAGEDGIAAYGVLMYVSMIFQAVFIGYAVGTSPIVGYNYGARNHRELRNILSKSIKMILVTAVFMFAAGQTFGRPLAQIFVGYDEELLALTARGFFIFSFSFLFSGFSIYGSSYFTALNDGLTSALISFLRTLVFESAAVLIFPLIWKIDGIWMSTVAAEVMAVIITSAFLLAKRKKYGY